MLVKPSPCKKFVACGKMKRSRAESTKLPTITPGMLPIPPSTSIARMNTLTWNWNCSVDTSCSFEASAQPPPRPPEPARPQVFREPDRQRDQPQHHEVVGQRIETELVRADRRLIE